MKSYVGDVLVIGVEWRIGIMFRIFSMSADRVIDGNAKPVAGAAAVVVPLHRFPLTEDEEVSLRVLRQVLGDHER